MPRREMEPASTACRFDALPTELHPRPLVTQRKRRIRGGKSVLYIYRQKHTKKRTPRETHKDEKRNTSSTENTNKSDHTKIPQKQKRAKTETKTRTKGVSHLSCKKKRDNTSKDKTLRNT